MQTNEFEQLKKEERARARSKAADKFWRSFLFTEGGRVKSTLLLNSFCLSVAFIAVYALAFYWLLDGLHTLVGTAPRLLANLVETLVPALAGTTVCSLAWFISKEKRLLFATYLWMALLALASFITMLIVLNGDPTARMLFFQFFLLLVPAPLLLGGGLSLLLYRRHRGKRLTALCADPLKRL